jgi:uncharacterized paraquat-inducible protein A
MLPSQQLAQIASSRTTAQLVGVVPPEYEMWMECEDCEMEFHVEAVMVDNETAEADCPKCGVTMTRYFE